MGRITRSTGTPVVAGGAFYGMAGGGYTGITPELDNVVQEAALALAKAYSMDITIRFNSDRESGGAWLVTHPGAEVGGGNAEVGIGGNVVTARCRAAWERWARQAGDCPEEREYYEGALRENPEGSMWVHAHIRSTSADPRRLAALRKLDGWNDMGGREDGYHHGEAESVAKALERCLYYAPPRSVLRVPAR